MLCLLDREARDSLRRSPAAHYCAACRFFHSREDFEIEQRIYEDRTFRACLPELILANDNARGDVQSHSGYTFPPFLVMDRGITLDQWLEVPRSPGAVLVMATEVAELLATLHAGGTVHRDIKPGNLLLVLRTQKWRLLDFGIAAPVGARCAANPPTASAVATSRL